MKKVYVRVLIAGALCLPISTFAATTQPTIQELIAAANQTGPNNVRTPNLLAAASAIGLAISLWKLVAPVFEKRAHYAAVAALEQKVANKTLADEQREQAADELEILKTGASTKLSSLSSQQKKALFWTLVSAVSLIFSRRTVNQRTTQFHKLHTEGSFWKSYGVAQEYPAEEEAKAAQPRISAMITTLGAANEYPHDPAKAALAHAIVEQVKAFTQQHDATYTQTGDTRNLWTQRAQHQPEGVQAALMFIDSLANKALQFKKPKAVPVAPPAEPTLSDRYDAGSTFTLMAKDPSDTSRRIEHVAILQANGTLTSLCYSPQAVRIHRGSVKANLPGTYAYNQATNTLTLAQ